MRERGFTLIEVLIVLTIVIFIISFSTIRMTHISEQKNLEYFIDMFEKDIFLMQQLAISNNIIYSLQFNTKDNYYFIYDSPLNPPVLKRTFDSNINISFLTLSNPIRYQPSGNIMNPGTIKVSYNNKSKQIIFPFGKGRFYVS